MWKILENKCCGEEILWYDGFGGSHGKHLWRMAKKTSSRLKYLSDTDCHPGFKEIKCGIGAMEVFIQITAADSFGYRGGGILFQT